ncbi:hypothetical protein CYMTET_51468 [Cymbomonas tetramitiformis]|uniref:Uncharacterized protein n=1 Tax=Cymbomonas tetramitiformis TaxID=36881 RepID=A0AAE0BMV6_9CHLO|nr:hypothetical protein CYMTET_51468 [Cymbomonas tetramitiformis]
MVASTRATASMANRRRALATIFDSEAARHANTPATPPAAQPAANSAGATFLASVRTLQREHFDMKTAFVTEDIGFAPLFLLDDATLPIRVEAGGLLFSTLELMVDPMSPAADWMDSSHSSFPTDGKRVLLEFARRMIPTGPHSWTKTSRPSCLFIKALDTVFYQPVVSRLLLHDQRADHDDLLTIQQWVRECYAAHVKAGTATASGAHMYSHGTHFMEKGGGSSDGPGELADLRTMVLDLKRQLAAFVASDRAEPSPRGFTPRADKQDRRMKTRFAADPLPRGGNWSQSVSKKVAFHRDTGATVPYCQNQVCAKGKARHWHRDCPKGGRNGLSAYAFAEEAENSVSVSTTEPGRTRLRWIRRSHSGILAFGLEQYQHHDTPDSAAAMEARPACDESMDCRVVLRQLLVKLDKIESCIKTQLRVGGGIRPKREEGAPQVPAVPDDGRGAQLSRMGGLPARREAATGWLHGGILLPSVENGAGSNPSPMVGSGVFSGFGSDGATKSRIRRIPSPSELTRCRRWFRWSREIEDPTHTVSVGAHAMQTMAP